MLPRSGRWTICPRATSLLVSPLVGGEGAELAAPLVDGRGAGLVLQLLIARMLTLRLAVGADWGFGGVYGAILGRNGWR